jgi:Zn-dependent membrane protease YugP
MTDDDELRAKAEEKVDAASALVDRHGTVFRWLWIALGTILVVAGIAMIVLPGPVTIVVPAGLVMLAAVFGWARRALLVTIEKGAAAKDAYEHADRWVKVLGWAASTCLAATVVAVLVL